MDHYLQSYNAQNTAVQIPLMDNSCHIKLDPEVDDHSDMEAVWCSLCQRPYFGDVNTDICFCTSFSNTIDSWSHKPMGGNYFQTLQTSNYDAIDSWLQMSTEDEPAENLRTSHHDATITRHSSLPASTRLGALSTNDASSSTTSATPPSECRSPEVVACDWDQIYNRMTPKEKRRSQNRASQRTFRERKAQLIKDLQARVEELTELNGKLSNEISILQNDI